jgi:hypothetical protein
MENDRFKVLISGDPDYSDLVAEVDYEGEFLCLISQDTGFDNLKIEISPRIDGGSWHIDLKDLLDVLEHVKSKLWSLRKIEDQPSL